MSSVEGGVDVTPLDQGLVSDVVVAGLSDRFFKRGVALGVTRRVYQHCALGKCRNGVSHHWQIAITDVDGVSAVGSRMHRLAEDQGDRLSHVVDLVDGQYGVVRDEVSKSREEIAEIVGGDHSGDALDCERVGFLDLFDRGVGTGRTYDGSEQHVG